MQVFSHFIYETNQPLNPSHIVIYFNLYIVTLFKFEILVEMNFIYYFDDTSTLTRIVHQETLLLHSDNLGYGIIDFLELCKSMLR